MVHQHFMLVPVFTVTENVILGTEPTGAVGTIDRDEARRRVLDLSAEYGLEVDPDAIIEELPVGIQQRVEILKALYRQANCLILDEPTSVLTPNEIDELMQIITSLKEGGRSIIFISHKLKEVLAVADDIAVLRRGRVVGAHRTRQGRRADAGLDDGRARRQAGGRQDAGRAPGTRCSRSTTWWSSTPGVSGWSTA